MVEFQNNHFTFSLKQRTSKSLLYPYLDELQDKNNISSVSTSCGCSKAEIGDTGITVSYTAKTIAPQLNSRGFQNVTKTITVNFINGESKTLSFTATVNR